MVNLVLNLCDILYKSLNTIIVIVAIVEVFLAIIAGINLSGLKRNIDKFHKKKSVKRTSKKTGKGEINVSIEMTDNQSWFDYDEFLEKYQKRIRWYDFFAQIIQILPLLGMLGTVAGLYIAINEGQNIYEGVGFALSSTVLGILFAIIFKIVEMFFIAGYIRHIDEGMDRFEKEYNINRDEAK